MHHQDILAVLRQLDSSEKGLTKKEAQQRLAISGLNELKVKKGIHPWQLLLAQFSSPLTWILLVALMISTYLGEIVNVIVIGMIVLINTGLGFSLEFRAEKAIEALQKISALTTKVLRDGKEIRIESKYLVPGDIILLEAGDKVPADARLLTAHDLRTQEGSLTGESQPVAKVVRCFAQETPLAERKNMVYSSTIVSVGSGKAVVVATGSATEIGKIATLLKETQKEITPLQKKLGVLAKYLTTMVVFITLVVFFVGLWSGESIFVMFLTAVALAVAAVPEGLPAVITVSLAMGIQRMVKKNVLMRKLSAVETLGSVDVICSDKTGTLTHNEMTVTHLWANKEKYTISGTGYNPTGTFLNNNQTVNPLSLHPLLKIGMLCNNAKFEKEQKKNTLFGDPTEAALLIAAQKAGLVQEKLIKEEPRVDEISFSSERKMMTTLHQAKARKISYTKGAPEVLLSRCTRILNNGKISLLTPSQRKEILHHNELFGSQALRVLAFAFNSGFSTTEVAEKNMVFVGLQAMLDPPRQEVKASIQKCHDAGIRVIMITGDQLPTAMAIAQQLGIPGKAITGQALEKSEDLQKSIREIGVFARVNPEHKLRLIEALKKEGHTVAMTGDGVNDAPALMKADIGIGMGITGTDVAKEASDMILTDDNFTSIVNAVEEGRGIFDNIRKFVNYLLSSNLAEIFIIFFAVLFGWPLPLTALQLLWINLVTDGLPATSLSLDPYEKEIMKRKPLRSKENIINWVVGRDILLMGVFISIITLFLYWLYQDTPKAQTMVFTALVLFEMVRLQMIRSEYGLKIFSNTLLIVAEALSIGLQVVVLYTPLHTVFGVVALNVRDWMTLLGAALLLAGINQLVIIINRKNLMGARKGSV